MIYKHSHSKTLDPELFRDPPKEFGGAPFWAWNCDLEKDELLSQCDVMDVMGFGGYHMHVRTGMSTKYLSDEFMDMIKACCDKAKENGMYAYLYDEDRWPSGAAGGIVTKDERFRERHLLFTAKKLDLEKVNADPDGGKCSPIAAYDIYLDENDCLAGYELVDTDAPEKDGALRRYAYLRLASPSPWYNNQTYIDTLNPEAIKRFIEVTHERYKEYLKDYFGDTVPSIFTDEPQFTHKEVLFTSRDDRDVKLPWTDDFPDTFKAAYGADIVASLPEVFYELPDGKVSETRYRFHDHIAERFASAFADLIGAWCDANGIALTGHMMEEPSLNSQTRALGEAMRSYRGFGLPGIDMLCNSREYTTAKQAQSATHQYGREGVLSELYGVTGWNYDFRMHKLHGDWQAALGVTLRVPHLAWVSMEGEAKRDYPASINYQSPWYKEYSAVENHFARVNTALTRGKPVVKVGVIHPVESFWLHMGPNDKTAEMRHDTDERFIALTEWLLKGTIDFDFICESLLPSQCAEGGKPLKVGEMEYDTILVPSCETLRSTTLERLEAFRNAGGRLIFAGEAPKYENAVESARGAALAERSVRVPFERTAILDACAPSRLVDVFRYDGLRAGKLIYNMRQDTDCRWLFFAQAQDPDCNDKDYGSEYTIVLKGRWSAQKYDTLSGEISDIRTKVVGDSTRITLVMYGQDSLLLRLTDYYDNAAAAFKKILKSAGKPLPLPRFVKYELSEPNVLLLDTARFAVDDGPFSGEEEEILRLDNIVRQQLHLKERSGGIAQPWTVTEEKPTHTVTLRFFVNTMIDLEGVLLALEKPEQAGISLNGEAVPADVTGWYTDKSIKTVRLPKLQKGSNTLDVKIPIGNRTNTEWCYLLGDFGVSVSGRNKMLIPRQQAVSFGDLVPQGLPFYGGAIKYIFPVTITEKGRYEIAATRFRGAVMKLRMDGKELGRIFISPYRLVTDELEAGEHELEIELFLHRFNAFGAVHNCDKTRKWHGPDAWRTEGCAWSYEYCLKRLGLLKAPEIRKIEEVDQ